ncbi:MAG: hypothetical protein Q8R87_10235 [Anaerolineaceae bacterium]|nr:hypothetical protein [Anaerolineaceae bacterium]
MNDQEKKPLFHRRSIRLPDYDYSSSGSYFITLVCHQREHLFGEIVEGEMRVNEYGRIAREEWLKTQKIRPNVEVLEDEFVVMPNHFHGIVHIISSDKQNGSFNSGDELVDDCVGKGSNSGDELVRAYSYTPLPERVGFQSPARTLGSIVRRFKIAVTTRINTLRATPGQPVWLRNYYEHIISTEKDYENIVNYIFLNPLNWELNDEYGDRKGV